MDVKKKLSILTFIWGGILILSFNIKVFVFSHSRLIRDLELPVVFFFKLLICWIPLTARCEAVKHGNVPSSSASGPPVLYFQVF